MPHYCIYHKNRVLLTADKWQIGRINSVLAELELNKTLYPSDEGTVPIYINNDTKILIYKEERPNINPNIQHHAGPTYKYEDDMIVGIYTVEDLPLPIAKDIARTKVTEHRKRSLNKLIEIGLPLQPNEIVSEYAIETGFLNGIQIKISTDDVTLARLTHNINMLPGKTIKWKFEDKWLDINTADVKLIVSTLNSYRQLQFNTEYDLNMRINRSNSLEQIKIIHEELDNMQREDMNENSRI